MFQKLEKLQKIVNIFEFLKKIRVKNGTLVYNEFITSDNFLTYIVPMFYCLPLKKEAFWRGPKIEHWLNMG